MRLEFKLSNYLISTKYCSFRILNLRSDLPHRELFFLLGLYWYIIEHHDFLLMLLWRVMETLISHCLLAPDFNMRNRGFPGNIYIYMSSCYVLTLKPTHTHTHTHSPCLKKLRLSVCRCNSSETWKILDLRFLFLFYS